MKQTRREWLPPSIRFAFAMLSLFHVQTGFKERSSMIAWMLPMLGVAPQLGQWLFAERIAQDTRTRGMP